MTALEFGLVQSIFTLGGLVGALAAGPLSGKRGRLYAMRLNTIPTIIGPIVAALSPSVALMAIGRFLSGVGAGASLVIVPIYISEISPPESRGFYGSFTQGMTNAGIFVAQSFGYFLSHDSAWRIILAIAGLIAIVQVVGLLAGVESPKWLGERGRWSEARTGLVRLRGTEENVDEEINGWKKESGKGTFVPLFAKSALIPYSDTGDDNETTETQGLLEPSSEHTRPSDKDNDDLTFFDVIRTPRYRPAIFAVLLVMASQQLTGINSIVMYGISILTSLLSSSATLLNIFVSLVNVVATFGFAPLSDNPRLGRKGCLLVSIAGMGISSILLGIGIRAGVKILSAICVLTFVLSFAFGLGPVPFMLASEMVDVKGVSATQSWALAGNWIATFLVAQFFPIVNEALGKGNAYFLFAGLAVFFFVAVGRFVPETRGKKGMAEVWGLQERSLRED